MSYFSIGLNTYDSQVRLHRLGSLIGHHIFDMRRNKIHHCMNFQDMAGNGSFKNINSDNSCMVKVTHCWRWGWAIQFIAAISTVGYSVTAS
jgi:hypothetical protein